MPKPNRSIPPSTVIPVLTYPDVRAAVAWLSSVFGFRERVQIGEDHRSQMQFGDGSLIVADASGDRVPPRAGEVTHSVMVRVDDARAHCEHARAAGARILMELTDFEYGERQYSVEDLAGRHWTFSETLADVAPEQWGGVPREDGEGADSRSAPDAGAAKQDSQRGVTRDSPGEMQDSPGSNTRLAGVASDSRPTMAAARAA